MVLVSSERLFWTVNESGETKMKRFTSMAAMVMASFVLSACVELSGVWQDFVEFADLEWKMPADGDAVMIVYFDFDKDDINQVAQSEIDALAASLADIPQIDLIVTGHTDTAGDAAYNVDLSQRRADAVRDALVAAGIGADRARVEIYAEGESNPAVMTGDDVPERRNRRVTVIADYADGGG